MGLNRREFLKAAGAATLFTIVPRWVLGGPKHIAPSDQLTKGIIGVGGITCAEDVLEFLYAGASAVEVGAQNFVDPYCCVKIIDELPDVLRKYGIHSVEEAIGRSLK